jgi:aerobic carbon-monoxide dehydrogenase medium subunit
MVRFELLEPKNLSEACSLLAEHKEKAKIVAGGQGLLPLLKHRQLRPKYLINIKNLPGLEYIDDGRSGLRIGALTTNRAIEISSLIKQRHPMLAELEGVVGDVQTRNWGTLVGNLCAASPTSDPAPALIALGATMKVLSISGERAIPMEEFFVEYLKTALEPDEIVTELQIPNPPPYAGGAYHKERVRMTDSPIASVAAVVSLDERTGRVRAARIVLQAVCPTPLRAKEAENWLIGKKVQGGVLEKTAILAGEAACPISDVFGSAEYKREMVQIATSQVITQAIERAQAS